MGLDSFAGGQSFDSVLQSKVCPRELFIPFFKFLGVELLGCTAAEGWSVSKSMCSRLSQMCRRERSLKKSMFARLITEPARSLSTSMSVGGAAECSADELGLVSCEAT